MVAKRSREPRTIVQRPGGKKFFLKRRNRSAGIVVRAVGRQASSNPSDNLRPAGDPVGTGVVRAVRAWTNYLSNREFDCDAIYIYLTTVFEIIQEWRQEGKAKQYSLQALKRAEFSIRMKPDPYARLIYCTSKEDDPKSRSKWAKVMGWVKKYNKRGHSFDKFVKRHGGLNDCAEMARFDLEPKAY
jgi:hypothetical protein